MLTARCQEPGCTWTFSGTDRTKIDEERDRHFMTHPWVHGSAEPMPRFPALSDDGEIATGHIYRPRPNDD